MNVSDHQKNAQIMDTNILIIFAMSHVLITQKIKIIMVYVYVKKIILIIQINLLV